MLFYVKMLFFAYMIKIKFRFLTFYILLILLISLDSYSQIGGNSIYKFLSLPNSARMSAVGGYIVAAKDDDVTLTFQNPSLLNSSMDNRLGFTFLDYFTDIGCGYAAYSKSYKKVGSFCAGIQYVNYGNFKRADATSQILGDFTAADYCLNIGYSRQLDSLFTIGIDVKNIYSVYDIYKSYGLAADIAFLYFKQKSQFAASVVVKNIGKQITEYVDGNKEPLPYEIQAGISQRLKHLPFRFFINLTHLEKFDLTYVVPDSYTDANILSNDTAKETKWHKYGVFGDKCLRHVVIGGELMPVKNFFLRFGYNYQRRQELKFDTRMGMAGFSFGVGLRVYRFHISYSRAVYDIAGKTNHFTITTNLNEFLSAGKK
ncbi:MAG: type IX secretion system protein PorQ [Bacteroidales bacterium]|nr:type IX secretion system protein PorQ [Bacteroidales bacterium]